MSGEHFGYESCRVKEWFDTVSQDREVRKRWPRLSLLFKEVGKVLLDAEHTMNWDLSGDTSIEGTDHQFVKRVLNDLRETLEHDPLDVLRTHRRAACEELEELTAHLQRDFDPSTGNCDMFDAVRIIDTLRLLQRALVEFLPETGTLTTELEDLITNFPKIPKDMRWPECEQIISATRTQTLQSGVLERVQALIATTRKEVGHDPPQDPD